MNLTATRVTCLSCMLQSSWRPTFSPPAPPSAPQVYPTWHLWPPPFSPVLKIPRVKTWPRVSSCKPGNGPTAVRAAVKCCSASAAAAATLTTVISRCSVSATWHFPRIFAPSRERSVSICWTWCVIWNC